VGIIVGNIVGCILGEKVVGVGVVGIDVGEKVGIFVGGNCVGIRVGLFIMEAVLNKLGLGVG
jgi:hypothetical protein